MIKRILGTKAEDLEGRKFVMLTVKEYVNKSTWLCECDCGKTRVVAARKLKACNIISCGCVSTASWKKSAAYKSEAYGDSTKVHDLTGKRYGMLTAKKYAGDYTWLCECDCGKTKVFTARSLSDKKSCGCMKESRGEFTVAQELDSLGVAYEREKRFDTCRNINPLPFDFFVPSANLLIEFQGTQHYKAVALWGGKVGFLNRKRLDGIKSKWARKNGYKFIAIHYNDINRVGEILSAAL